ncbi:hypothetical protein BC830DRAFT_1166106 [Chytriomyces sp. MP71]|nr:hypothetical protein BC830DRAFT_1166106 [Chytriomyces sp. MP71]
MASSNGTSVMTGTGSVSNASSVSNSSAVSGAPAPIEISLGNFQAALLFNGLVTLGLIVAFLIVRPQFPATYASRLFSLDSKKQPARLGKSILSLNLVKAVLTSDSAIVSQCGHDAYAAIFYVRTMTMLFIVVAFPASAILLPINITGGNALQGINLLTLGNVADEKKLYAHFFMALYTITLTLLAIFRIILESVRLRVLHHKRQDTAARVLMVRDVPPEWRNERDMMDIFNRVCPDSVDKVIIPNVVPSVQVAQAKSHLAARNKLESTATAYLSKVARAFKQGTDPDLDTVPPRDGDLASSNDDVALFGKLRATHRVAELQGGAKSRTVDSLAEYALQFRETQRQMLQSCRDRKEATQLDPVSTLFVVFKDPFDSHLAARALVHDTPWVMAEKVASVRAEDVIWANADTTFFHREWRSALTRLIMFGMIIFWGVIVAAVLSLTDLANLGKSIPAFQTFLNNNQSFAKVVGGILPSVIVAVLLSLVPPILRYLSVFGGSPLNTRTDSDVFSGYFMFQMINVFAVNVIGSSLLASFNQIKDQPSSVLDILAKSIPQSANFFIQFLLVRGLSAPSLELIQAARLITGPIMIWLFGKTPRALFAARQPPVFIYATAMASHGLTVTIGLVFSVLAPIVMLFVVAYFALYTVVYMYMMQYVYNVKTSTGGKFLFTAANQCFVGLFIMEFMIFALFLLHENIVTSVLMIITVVLTMWAYAKAQQFMAIVETVPVSTMAKKATEYTAGINFTPAWIAYLFPGVNPDENEQAESELLLELDVARTYADPSFGSDDLKVWIPKCSVGTAFHDLVEEVVADGSVVSDALIVTTGAAVNARGGVVISDGKYDAMAAL